MTKMIFIDTEFTNFIDTSLISMGLVADTGEEFYVEVSFNVTECSAFVREAVLPQLGSSEHDYCSRPNLRTRILNWLGILRNRDEPIVIGFDYQTDWDLFCDALDNALPALCTGTNVAYCLSSLLLSDHYKITGDTEHHALHDARANRYAYRAPVVTEEEGS